MCASSRLTVYPLTVHSQEIRTRIQNRLRTLLEVQIQANKTSIDAWLFRIYAEMHVNARGVNVKAVQLLFERAVRALQQAPSVRLWQLYIDWTLSQQELPRAKALLSRALQECPWSKGQSRFLAEAIVH